MTSQQNNELVFQEAELHHFTNTPPWTLMMTDAQVVKRTITTNDNSASQDFSYQALLQKFKFSTKID